MKRTGSPYWGAIRTIPFLCGGGWVAAVVGFAMKINWLAKTGLILFLAGFAVWGFANGGAFVWAMTEGLRKDGLGALARNPWSSALFILLMLFFLSAGVWFVWFLVRIAQSKF